MGNYIKKILIGFLSAIMICNFVACGNTAVVKKDKEAKTKVYTDMMGRKVEISTDIKRVIALRYMEVNLLASILGEDFDDKVISVGQDLKTNDIDVYNKYSEIFSMDKLVDVGSVYDDAVSPEKILELKPDIIIVDTYFSNKNCVKKMIELGLPVVFIDSDGDGNIYNILESMDMLGEMFNKKEKVNKMTDYARAKIKNVLDVVDTIKSSNKKKPSVYFELGDVTPEEIGTTRGDTKSGLGLLLKSLGAENIGEGNGSEKLNPEKVLASNPDIIMIGGANWDQTANIMRFGYYVTEEQASSHLGEYINRPGWSELNAIKNKRLCGFHFNYAKYPYNFAMIEYMAKQIWPEEFKDLDPQADLEEFFKEYMPIDYSGIFFASCN